MKKIDKAIIMEYMKKFKRDEIEYDFREKAILMFLNWMNETRKVFKGSNVIVKDDKNLKDVDTVSRYELFEVEEV